MLMASTALVILAGCGDSEKDARGIDYVPDMYDSPAYKSQQAQVTVLTKGAYDGKALRATLSVPAPDAKSGVEVRHSGMMLTPPAGTMPRDFTPYQLDMLDIAAAKALRNPLLPTPDVLRRGQASFAVYCTPCHGNDGNSINGYVAASAAFPHRFTGIPALNASNVAALSDGELFHIITTGKPRMPSYRAQLMPESRWAVVHYLRALNRAALAATDTAAALKAAEDEMAAKVDDPKVKADLELKKRIAVEAKIDLERIKRGGGAEYVPRPAPRPEYESQWPEK